MLKSFISHMVPYVLFAAPFMAAAVILYSESPKPPERDPDEATFMMECVYEWGQTPDNCRKILQGEDPAPLPEPEDGC